MKSFTTWLPQSCPRWERLRLFVRATTGASALLAALLYSAACGQVQPAVTAVTFATPQALVVNCASPPVDLSAQMWVSGRDSPCTLSVDQSAGTTSGQCRVAAGRERRLAVDWFVMRQGVRILLAQARRTIDLTGATEDEVVLTLSADDVTMTDCLDFREDQFDGATTQQVGGNAMPVCDLDDSCVGTLAVDCSNLGELCAGTDPLLP